MYRRIDMNITQCAFCNLRVKLMTVVEVGQGKNGTTNVSMRTCSNYGGYLHKI